MLLALDVDLKCTIESLIYSWTNVIVSHITGVKASRAGRQVSHKKSKWPPNTFTDVQTNTH